MPAPLLRIAHLTKKFGDAIVVDDLSLEIMPGECLGVIGPNGAGKTTTIRICLGLTGPDDGEIEAFGLPLPAQVREAKKRDRRRQPVRQPRSRFHLRREPARLRRLLRPAARARSTSACPSCSSSRRCNRRPNAKPGELSGGMKRRLSLGRALVNDPDLLILDEPTTGLDPQARHLMWERLQNLLQQGKAILLTTHFMDEAERLCDRLLVLDHGRKIAEGTPRELIAEHLESDVVEVYGDGAARWPRRRTRRWPSASRPAARRCSSTCATPSRCSTALADDHSIRYLHRPANLEDLFLKLTGRQIRDDERLSALIDHGIASCSCAFYAAPHSRRAASGRW